MDKKMNEIIREQRKKQNLTQEQLAEKLNVSSKTISKWETGLRLPDTEIIPILAKVLNISIDELFCGVKFENEVIGDYDYNEIKRFKNKILISIFLLFTPLLMFAGTFLNNLALFYIFLIIGILCVIFSFYLLISTAINFRFRINTEYNHPKYTYVYKNNILTYLLVLYTLVFVLLGITDNILFPILLNILISCFIFLVMNYIPIKINIVKIIPLLILCIACFILGCILVSFISYLPYYLFLFLSQIWIFIAMFVNAFYFI